MIARSWLGVLALLVACAHAPDAARTAPPASSTIAPPPPPPTPVVTETQPGFEIGHCEGGPSFVRGLGTGHGLPADVHAWTQDTEEAWRARVLGAAYAALTARGVSIAVVHSSGFGRACAAPGVVLFVSDPSAVDALLHAVGTMLRDEDLADVVGVLVEDPPTLL